MGQLFRGVFYCLLTFPGIGLAQQTQLQSLLIQRHGASSGAALVLVDNAALAHTPQLLARNGNSNSLANEIRDVADQLSDILAKFGCSSADLVKLNVFAADNEATTLALDFFSTWCPADSRPAVAAVVTKLPNNRRIALDAVFVVRQTVNDTKVTHELIAGMGQSVRNSHVSVLPRGDVVYVSGQAKSGDLAAATRASLDGLIETLKSLQLGLSDVVQVKCFLQPMSQVDVANRQIVEFFGKAPLPAISHVEWITNGSRPIEIEIVAAAPRTNTAETVSYFTPAGMKASPVFSRVARIHGNRRIYLSGLVSTAVGDGSEQVHSIFQQLIRQLKPVRSNLRHLAKATYYVSDGEASSQLNQIRPHYYDAERPPAASKALVQGTGNEGRTISVDMIAAPEPPLTRVLTSIARNLTPSSRVAYKTIGERKLHLNIFEPDDHRPTDRRPVFLCIHGGGWTGGNVKDFHPFAAYFANQGMLGVSLEYRLKNEKNGTTVFDCVRDARSAVRWIRKNADRLGGDPTSIVAMGGSAGGHLAISTALFDSVNDDSDDVAFSARPDALVLMYPVIDTSPEGYGQAKIGDLWRDLSPLHNVRQNLPPTLIFHGTADAVTPYVGAKKFHELSSANGNRVKLITQPGGRHGYIIFDRRHYDRSLMQTKEFLERLELLPTD